MVNRGLEDKIFNSTVYILLAIVGIVALFPLLFVLSASLTPYSEVLRNGGFIVFPRSITFDAYIHLLTDNLIPRAFVVTVIITVVGTTISLILTTLLAYPLSRGKMPGRRLFLLLVLFTFLFNGGIIPTYLIVRATGLIDTLWAMMIPNAIGAFHVLIMKTFFERLPGELFEASRIDGAGEFRVLYQIVLPISIPVMMTLGLFYAVMLWNGFFPAIMYINNTDLYPLQVVVRNILMQTQSPEPSADVTLPTVTVQMASVIIASLPMILIYPFIQKHFTKGMLLGSVKG